MIPRRTPNPSLQYAVQYGNKCSLTYTGTILHSSNYDMLPACHEEDKISDITALSDQ